MPSSKLQPALLGGLLLGVLSALPLVGRANICCCLWVLAGGVVAAYLLQAGQPTPITLGDGVVVGFGAGLFGAVIWFVLSIPADMLEARIGTAVFGRFAPGGGLPDTSGLPEEARRVIQALFENPVLRLLVKAVSTFFISIVITPIGGLVGAAMFRKKAAPTPVRPPAPPPPPPPDAPWSANS